jgi:hypothetical protein
MTAQDMEHESDASHWERAFDIVCGRCITARGNQTRLIPVAFLPAD